jgi:hypothetical protein
MILDLGVKKALEPGSLIRTTAWYTLLSVSCTYGRGTTDKWAKTGFQDISTLFFDRTQSCSDFQIDFFIWENSVFALAFRMRITELIYT